MVLLSRKLLLSCTALIGLVAAGAAHAATQTVTANVAFDTPLSIGGTPTIDFGTVRANTTETYNVSTAGTLTAVGSSANILYGTASAAALTITGSTTQAIDITANNYTAVDGSTPSAAVCDYASGGSVACTTLTGVAAPGASTTLAVGVQLDVTNTNNAAGDTDAPTFDIVVTYN